MSEQDSSAKTSPPGKPPVGTAPAFALNFRDAGVALMRREFGVATMRKGGGFSLSERPGGAWSEVARCAWLPAKDGVSPDILLPERLLAGLGGQTSKVDIWLPEGLVLSRTVEDDPSTGDQEPAERTAQRAIPGLTILRPDALKIAATRANGKVAVRAVERSVLVEVCAHARRWGFDVAQVRSKPGDPDFPEGAVFVTKPPAPRRWRKRARTGARGKSAFRSRVLPVIGATAAAAAVALLFLYSPTEPDAPQPLAINTEAPVTTKTPGALRPRTETLEAGDVPSPEHAAAEPPPKFRSLISEVAYSAPAEQFTPIAVAPLVSVQPILEKFAPPPSGAAPIVDMTLPSAESLAVDPTEPPSEIETVVAAASADAIPAPIAVSIRTPTPPISQQIDNLGTSTSLSAVIVDDAAGAAGEELAPPVDAAPPGTEADLLEAKEPPAETPTDPPNRLSGLEELEETDYAALSLEEAPTPLAPPLSVRPEADPAAVPRPAFRPGATADSPPEPEGEFRGPPLSERAPDKVRPPKARPEAVALAARPPEAAEEAEPTLEISSLAPASVAAPRPRPKSVTDLRERLRQAAAQARRDREAKEKVQRALPTTAEISDSATRRATIETLDGFMLIGVFERVGARSALMRLPNGDVRRVENGDQIGRWTVAAVDSTSVNLRFQGSSLRLKLPGM